MGYFALSLLAGFFIGAAMFLVCVAAAMSPVAPNRLAMGLVMSVGLILVVFGGAELYTGNVLCGLLATFSKKMKLSQLLILLTVSLLGNVVGASLTGAAIWGAGLFENADFARFALDSAAFKTTAPAVKLLLRAALCNMFVTLGIWLCWRVKGEGAKIFMLVICVFAFVASGFEHCIANVLLLTGALLIDSDSQYVTVTGCLYNLAMVIVGNFLGGAIVAGAYFRANNGGK